jgi:hypothetical protein
MISKVIRRVISSGNAGGILAFAFVFLCMSGLCGCTYHAQLYEGEPFEPGAEVTVVCKTNEKPVVDISESGDFLFWAMGGPGPVAAGTAYIVNESTNRQHESKLKSTLHKNSYSDILTAELKKSLEDTGLRVKKIKKEYRGVGDIVTLGLAGPGSGRGVDKQSLEYILVADTKYGLFDSEAQCSAQIEGRLISVADDKTVWKNKLCFEGRTGAKHKAFGDGKEAVKQWQEDPNALEEGLEEAIKGVCDLLRREFSGSVTEDDDKKLTKLKLKPGGKVKAKITEQSPERVVLRLKGGSVRSIPACELVTERKGEVALNK